MIRIEIDDAILSLNSAHPNEGSPPYWSGDSTELAKWLPGQFGMFGHYVGDYPCPSDTIHALIISGKKYRVTEGQEILDLPIEPLPEGVVS
jgi:hypothetical protein